MNSAHGVSHAGTALCVNQKCVAIGSAKGGAEVTTTGTLGNALPSFPDKSTQMLQQPLETQMQTQTTVLVQQNASQQDSLPLASTPIPLPLPLQPPPPLPPQNRAKFSWSTRDRRRPTQSGSPPISRLFRCLARLARHRRAHLHRSTTATSSGASSCPPFCDAARPTATRRPPAFWKSHSPGTSAHRHYSR